MKITFYKNGQIVKEVETERKYMNYEILKAYDKHKADYFTIQEKLVNFNKQKIDKKLLTSIKKKQ